MTWFRCGGSGIPAALKNRMNAVLNKKFGTAVDYPAEGWPDNVNLLGPLPEATVSGSIAHITDGADEVPLKSCEVALPASLDGYSSVDVVQTGKNLFNYEDVEAFNSGVIITRNNGDYTVQNNNSYTVGAFRGILFHLKPAIYSLSIGEAISVPIRIYKNGSWFNNGINAGDTSCTFTVSKEADYDFACNVFSNSSLTIKKCQFEVGSTASTYEPYVAPTTYTVNLGRTIYGGKPDIVNGEGSETFARIDLGSLTYTYGNNVGMQSNGISSLIQNPPDNYTKTTAIASDYTADTWQIVMNSGTSSGLFGVSGGYVCFSTTETDPNAFKASMSGKYLVFPLSTPTDFTFTPITPTPKTALGTNNFWSEEGDTTVVYRRDIDLALQAVSSSRGLMMASRPVTQLIGEQADLDQVNELNEETENTEEQEGEQDAR